VYDQKNDKVEKYDYQDFNDNWDKRYITDEFGKIKKLKRNISEDVCFFEHAKELGYKIYADVTAQCSHFKGKPELRKLKNQPKKFLDSVYSYE